MRNVAHPTITGTVRSTLTEVDRKALSMRDLTELGGYAQGELFTPDGRTWFVTVHNGTGANPQFHGGPGAAIMAGSPRGADDDSSDDQFVVGGCYDFAHWDGPTDPVAVLDAYIGGYFDDVDGCTPYHQAVLDQ